MFDFKTGYLRRAEPLEGPKGQLTSTMKFVRRAAQSIATLWSLQSLPRVHTYRCSLSVCLLGRKKAKESKWMVLVMLLVGRRQTLAQCQAAALDFSGMTHELIYFPPSKHCSAFVWQKAAVPSHHRYCLKLFLVTMVTGWKENYW